LAKVWSARLADSVAMVKSGCPSDSLSSLDFDLVPGYFPSDVGSLARHYAADIPQGLAGSGSYYTTAGIREI
jgi:hypothetical protein